MLHRYPEGKPKEDRPAARQHTRKEETKQGKRKSAEGKKNTSEKKHTSEKKSPSVHKETPSFQKRPFQVQEIPSPIHGLRGYPRMPAEEADPEELRKRELQPEEPSPLVFFDEGPPPVIEREEEPVQEEEETAPGAEVEWQESIDEPIAAHTEPEPAQPDEQPGQQHHESRAERARRREMDERQVTAPRFAAGEKKQGREPQPKGVRTSSEPYNVLMKPQDYVKQRRRSAGQAKKPGLHLLHVPKEVPEGQQSWVDRTSEELNNTLAYFRVDAAVVSTTSGPSVTRFEVQPAPGIKVSRIVQLSDDLKRSLAATDIRMEAPIPGKTTVGIEVPNPVPRPVGLREILHTPAFQQADSRLTAALGVDIAGNPVTVDIAGMPHGLIAGATGSGKSVCINSLLVSLLFKASPEEVRLLLIDPKVVELAPFRRIPHLAGPVITEPKEASAALNWAVAEMERRYELLAEAGVRDLARYNQKQEEKLPQLVIVIDELADLMMAAPSDVESAVCRLAQKARACGIHLLVATQRPSVDVITGLMKANIPTRIAFSVSSQADSRTIMDGGGAERLLGRGDMLYHPMGASKAVRLQGTFITDEEIEKVVEAAALAYPEPPPLFEPMDIKPGQVSSDDVLYEEAKAFVEEKQSASASMLQRHFQIGYNRAARLMDDMEADGMISAAKGSKPRDVYGRTGAGED